MSLFLLLSPAIAYFFLRSTLSSWDAAASLKLYMRGLIASFALALLYYFTRHLIPAPANNFFSFLHYWFYDYFIWLGGGTAIFVLTPSFMKGKGRKERLSDFLFGVICLSGLATFLHRGLPKDAYWVLILPIFRIGLLAAIIPLLDDLMDETGTRLGLLIAAAVGISFIPALFPLFHFWNRWYLSLPLLVACLAASGYFGYELFLHPLREEIDALKRGE